MSNDLNNIDFNDDETIEYKLILIGDTSVGKTTLFKKITSGEFLPRNVSTIGVDRKALTFICEFEEKGQKVSKNIMVFLTDTAGQEKYKSITKSYYKGSNGVILLYDITDKKSFDHVNSWMESIKNSVGTYEENKCSLFLLGTKLDLVEEDEKKRAVTVEEAQKKCKELELEWGGECSSKDFSDDKYKELFKEFIIKIYNKIGYNKIQRETISISNSHKRKKKSKCC